MNKFAAWMTVFLLAAPGCFGSDTAYHALRTLGKEKGSEVLNRVVSVEGRDGTPQPATWKIVVEDSVARAGVREFEVSNGHITSERAPARVEPGTRPDAVMDFGKLNLDSSGVFTIVEREAKKSKLGFDNVEYFLHRSSQGTTPIWVVRLVDAQHRGLSVIHVAADSGVVTQRLAMETRRRDGAPVDEPPPRTQPSRIPDGDEPDSNPEKEVHVGHEIDKALHRAGGTLQEFFTGKRTIDRRFRDE